MKTEPRRATAPVQVAKDLARMARIISKHRGETMADILDPVIRAWVVKTYRTVVAEMAAETAKS